MSLAIENQKWDEKLKTLFGDHAHSESPFSQSGAGVRFTGIDLYHPLNEQAGFLLDALA